MGSAYRWKQYKYSTLIFIKEVHPVQTIQTGAVTRHQHHLDKAPSKSAQCSAPYRRPCLAYNLYDHPVLLTINIM